MQDKTLSSTFALAAVATAAALFLVGCGGGGGGGSSSDAGGQSASTGTGNIGTVSQDSPSDAGNGSATGEQTAPSTITNDVPAPNYSTGTESQKAFALLNSERVSCGFGALAQNTQLDATAAGHANYLLVANYMGHYQNIADASQPYFTGNGPLDRATKAGYNAASITDEQTLSWGITDLTGRGEFSVRSLLNAAYHLKGMVSSARDVGISIMSSNDAGSTAAYGPRTVEQYNLGVATGSSPQLPSSEEVLTYPCQSTTGTFFELVNESPSPVPGRDLMANPLGQSVFVKVRDGQSLSITSAKMSVNAALGTQVSLRTPMVKSNDPNAVLSNSEALIIPDTALLPMTKYYVEIAGTNNGSAFSKSFTFTTGSATAR